MKTLSIQRDGLRLFTETFGSPSDTPVVLVMGAMSSGVWWPREFCEMLSERGRFVIRYDHRDTGGSSSYEPGSANYSIEDLASDAMRVLDGLEIDSAHFVGMSLGGYLTQLLALKYPTRVRSITLIASEPLASSDPDTPGMSPEVLEYHSKAGDLDWSDREAVLDYQVGAWALLSGSAHTFDTKLIRQLASEELERTPNPLTAFNHAQLSDASGWVDRLSEIQMPALIIHGTDDIVLPYAHAEALHAALPHSHLITLAGTGHELPRGDWPTIVDAIERHTG